MMKPETRRTLALSFSISYILLAYGCVLFDKSMPEQFALIVTTVIAYYFGGETALDQPHCADSTSTTTDTDQSDTEEK